MVSTTLADAFPGTLDAQTYADRTLEVLEPYGFTAENTLGCVGLCRDELTRPLVDLFVKTWGEAFDFSSLGAFPTLGRTGFGAARSHAPHIDGRERLIVMSMPHIGIDRDGVIGLFHRPHQSESTPACGALYALLDACVSGVMPDDLDPLDCELSMLRRRLSRLLPEQNRANIDIIELTRIIRKAGLADLEQLIADADMSGMDYAVLSGIQQHTPDGERIWPADSYVVVDGERHELKP